MCGFDHAAVHIHRSAGEREGVNVTRVHDLEIVLELRMLKLRGNSIHQSLSDARDIIGRVGVVQNRHLLLYFCGRLPADLDVICRFVFVAVIFDLRLRKNRNRHRKNCNDCQPCQQPLYAIGISSNHLSPPYRRPLNKTGLTIKIPLE